MAVSSSSELAAIAAEFAQDPYGYVMWVFPWDTPELPQKGPRKWQKEFLLRLGQQIRYRNFDGVHAVDPIRHSVVSGHGSGKTAMSAWLIKFVHDTRPNSKITVSASGEKSVATKTFAAVVEWHNKSLTKDLSKASASVNGPKLVRVGSRAVEANWFARGFSPNKENVESFQGQHSHNSTSMYLFDEASSIPEEFFDVIDGSMTEGEPMVFLFGNGLRKEGGFYRSHQPGYGLPWKKNTDPSKYSCWNIDISQMPEEEMRQAPIRAEIARRGENSLYVMTRIKGMFPPQSKQQLFDTDAVNRCMDKREFPSPTDPYPPLVIGVDVARLGDDRTVVYARRGRNARDCLGGDTIKMWEKNTMTELTSYIAHIQQKYAPDLWFIDSVGIGEGLQDDLYHHYGISNVVTVKASNKSRMPQIYQNKRAEIFCELRDHILEGMALPDMRELRDQLNATRYGVTEKDLVEIESKKAVRSRGGVSPDIVDALALTFAERVFSNFSRRTAFGEDAVRQKWRNQDRSKFGRLSMTPNEHLAKRRSRRV